MPTITEAIQKLEIFADKLVVQIYNSSKENLIKNLKKIDIEKQQNDELLKVIIDQLISLQWGSRYIKKGDISLSQAANIALLALEQRFSMNIKDLDNDSIDENNNKLYSKGKTLLESGDESQGLPFLEGAARNNHPDAAFELAKYYVQKKLASGGIKALENEYLEKLFKYLKLAEQNNCQRLRYIDLLTTDTHLMIILMKNYEKHKFLINDVENKIWSLRKNNANRKVFLNTIGEIEATFEAANFKLLNEGLANIASQEVMVNSLCQFILEDYQGIPNEFLAAGALFKAIERAECGDDLEVTLKEYLYWLFKSLEYGYGNCIEHLDYLLKEGTFYKSEDGKLIS